MITFPLDASSVKRINKGKILILNFNAMTLKFGT